MNQAIKMKRTFLVSINYTRVTMITLSLILTTAQELIIE